MLSPHIIFPLSISYRLTLKRGSRYIANTEYIHIRITVSQSVRILLRPFIYATSSRFPSPSNNCLVLDLQEILSRQVLVTDRNQGTIREEHRIPSYCTSFWRRCAIDMRVTSANSVWMMPWMKASVAGSTEDVASSNRRTLHLRTIARINATVP